MRALKIATAVVVVLVAVWVMLPVAGGYHIGQGSSDTQCLSRVFDWCRVAPAPAAVVPTTTTPADQCPAGSKFVPYSPQTGIPHCTP